MKIVIDISEELYEECKRLGDSRDTLFEAIRQGIPLPKGHGRLIDADALEINAPTLYDDFYAYPCLAVADLKEAPTIIEADKGEE